MSSLATKYRPSTFEEVIGQDTAVKLLKAITKDPDGSPKGLILYGPWGVGKTSLARLFSKALSCESSGKTGKICNTCMSCREFSTISNKYLEYDSSQVGSAQQVKDLKPVFEQWTDYYRVIVFDEGQLISRAGQAALLKTIEEGPKNTFFLFATTDYDKILKTIHSRSMPVEFFKVDKDIITNHLVSIWENEVPGEEPPKDVLEKVSFKSDGHVRDAVTLLAGYIVARDETVLNVPINDIAKFFLYLARGDNDKASGLVSDHIMRYPLDQIRRSINYVVMRMVEEYTLKKNSNYKVITDLLRDKVLKVFQLVSDLWVQGVFSNKELTYSFFLTVIRIYGKSEKG